jgi:hypothetical protein
MISRVGLGTGFVNANSVAKALYTHSIVSEKKWMQNVNIKRKGICTGDRYGSKSCPQGSRQYALATTFRKASKKGAAKHKK